MGENCNGLNNRISGNEKIANAIDIREGLDINCLMYCKHRLNFKHKENKNNLKQMFQRELACTAVSAHNIHEGKVAGRVQEGAQVPYVLEKRRRISKRQGKTVKA
jgi:hypothetical protein